MSTATLIYVDEPDIPVGMTIDEYRRSRPVRTTRWRRVLRGLRR